MRPPRTCPRCLREDAGVVPLADPLALVCRYCGFIWEVSAPEPVVRDGVIVGHIHHVSPEPTPAQGLTATGEHMAQVIEEAAAKHGHRPAVLHVLLKAFDAGYRAGLAATPLDRRQFELRGTLPEPPSRWAPEDEDGRRQDCTSDFSH